MANYFVLQLKDPANKVIATARDTAGSKGLQELAIKYPKNNLVLLNLDISEIESIQKVTKTVETLLPDGLDNFISNAGISHQPLATFDDL